MTSNRLQARSKKELVEIARKRGIAGWHGMRKEELLHALDTRKNGSRKSSKRLPIPAPRVASARPAVKTAAKPAVKPQRAAARDTTSGNPTPEETVERAKFDVGTPTKDLSAKLPKDLPSGYGKDRIVVMVRDPYWLHAYWELTHQSIQRAEAALGQDWHGAKPILRLFDVSSHETTSTSESIVKDIEIHGGCNNWYVEVSNPPRSFRIDVGYL